MRVDVETGLLSAADEARVTRELAISAREDPTAIDLSSVSAIRIDVPSFGDGSAFSLAHQLRLLGFKGPICIKGALLPDQVHMARGAGADTIEPTVEILARQNPKAWIAAAARYRTQYPSLLKRAV